MVTVSELARGFGHLSQGRSAVREQYATKAEVWGAYIRQWQRAEPLKAQFWDRPVNWRLTLSRRPDAAPYSSEVQQPMRATAITSGHPHTRNAAPSVQDRLRGPNWAGRAGQDADGLDLSSALGPARPPVPCAGPAMVIGQVGLG